MTNVQAGNIHLLEDVEVELIDYMGNDASIVQSARVSTQGQNELEQDEMSKSDQGLINYLMREKHGSPFEHATMTFYVKAPIFVFREFQRHRIASYNEMSGRYMELPPEFYTPSDRRPLINIGTSSKPEFTAGSSEQFAVMSEAMHDVYQHAWREYQNMIEAGIANEVARMVLPVGIMSQMYVTMNLRAMFNFLSLRTQRENSRHVSRPQHEIQMVANKIDQAVWLMFPVAYKAFEKNGRVAP